MQYVWCTVATIISDSNSTDVCSMLISAFTCNHANSFLSSKSGSPFAGGEPFSLTICDSTNLTIYRLSIEVCKNTDHSFHKI